MCGLAVRAPPSKYIPVVLNWLREYNHGSYKDRVQEFEAPAGQLSQIEDHYSLHVDQWEVVDDDGLNLEGTCPRCTLTTLCTNRKVSHALCNTDSAAPLFNDNS